MIEFHNVNNAMVARDNIYTHRWYDAFGQRVSKYLFDGTHWRVDDATHDPQEWTVTIVETGGGGDSTANLTDVAGGALLITTDNATNDGYKMQLGHGSTGAGENVDLSVRNPLYCGIEFAINDVDQTDFLFGVCVTDTSCLDGVDTAMYFRSVDEDADLYFVTEKDTVENATLVATMTDDTYITAEFLFDGGTVRAYIDGTEVAAAATLATAATFPNDELMRLTQEFLTGENVANTCTVRWLRMIHIR